MVVVEPVVIGVVVVDVTVANVQFHVERVRARQDCA